MELARTEASWLTLLRARARAPRPVCARVAGRTPLLLTSCSSGQPQEARSSEVPAGTAQPAQARAQPGPTIRVLAPESRPLTALERLETVTRRTQGCASKSRSARLMQDVLDRGGRRRSRQARTYDLVLGARQRAAGSWRAAMCGRSRRTSRHGPSPRTKGFVPQQDLFAGWWRATSWYRGNPYGYPFLARAMSLWYRSDLVG